MQLFGTFWKCSVYTIHTEYLDHAHPPIHHPPVRHELSHEHILNGNCVSFSVPFWAMIAAVTRCMGVAWVVWLDALDFHRGWVLHQNMGQLFKGFI